VLGKNQSSIAITAEIFSVGTKKNEMPLFKENSS
jgi:hypothetical protein